jgi:hypothetical protein
MSRSFHLLALAAALVGCVAGPKGGAEEEIEFVDGDEAADAFTRRLDLRGTIGFGGSVEGEFRPSVGYAGYLFTARGGGTVSIDARGIGDVDTVLSVYGPQRGATWSRSRPIATNDDSNGTFDSHIDLRIETRGTYLIVVREYWESEGAFSLALACTDGACLAECRATGARCPLGSECAERVCIRAPCPSYCEPIDPVTACEVDSDCVEAPVNCCPCSMGGYSRAVNASYADSAPECDPSTPIACPAVYLCRDERPACVENRCQMVEAPAEVSCGGRRPGGPFVCPDDQYCHYEVSDICGWADATGVCRTPPTACTREFRPVCGCDRVTYSNACSANAAGVSIQHEGECEG